MNILFVTPGKSEITQINKLVFKIFKINTQTLTFPILAGLTSKNHKIDVIHQSDEKIDYDKDYDIVGITSMTSTILDGYNIADKFRERDISVVIGGWHASALPDEAKKHADAVVVGEAEETWPQLLEDFKNNNLKPFYKQVCPVDPKKIPHPRTDIYPKGTNFEVIATRGCPHSCEFCTIGNQTYRKKFRMRPIDEVIYDIKSNPNKFFAFRDNSLTINMDYTKEIFKRMKHLNKKFYAMGNIDVLGSDDEFLKLSAEAGCTIWAIGFESTSQETLYSMGKKTNTVKEYIPGIKKIHDYGMSIVGFFVFGFDNDTCETFDKTHEFLRLSEIDIPLFHILTPYPGTPLFDRLDKEGRIFTKDWSRYTESGNVVFKPKNMTPDELKDYTKDLHKKWYNFNASSYRTLKSMRFGTQNLILTIFNNFHIRRLKY